MPLLKLITGLQNCKFPVDLNGKIVYNKKRVGGGGGFNIKQQLPCDQFNNKTNSTKLLNTILDRFCVGQR